MEKGIVLIVVFVMVILSFVFVSSEDSWNSFDDGSSVENNSGNISNEGNADSIVPPVEGSSSSSGGESSTKYTSGFYVAIGAGVIGLLIILYLLKSILIKPKFKW